MSLQTVGINTFTCPVRIPEKGGGVQHTVATIDLLAQMPRDRIESCVSVMTGLLARFLPDIHSGIFPDLLTQVREQLQAAEARLSMRFPYFIAKKAPISGTASLMEYQCTFTASSATSGEPVLTVVVPVTTLCPCSKEISAAGAHNQRAEITLTVRPLALIWLEDLIALAEACGSSEVYALLKRPDEKYVTERAYAQPMFVEDVARKVAQRAMAHPDVAWFSVGVESFESIHNHSAYALVDSRDLESPVKLRD
jgi:GTP cyclohydrolase I